jgi:Zn-dependent peptidase ImmA (M78 family)/transcriptional regulator with XRE-family HTH domain
VDPSRNASQLFYPRRLELARKVRGLKKKELAQHVGVSPAAISQYEAGQSKPRPSIVAQVALALGFPADFFSSGRPQSSLDPSSTHFRSLRATRQLERASAVSRAELAWELAQLLERYVRLPPLDLPEVGISETPSSSEIESVASTVRTSWSLPDGPIAHVVRLLEVHGVIVTRLVSGLSRVDAFSRWFDGRPLVVLYADKQDAARSRFDAAHELGHLVMHHDAEPGDAKAEKEAHAFAAAFLMPEIHMREQLPHRLDWPRLLTLKQVWGVSVAALLYRARTLGVMSDASYKRAMATMSKRGWRSREPVDIGPPEAPTLFARAIDLVSSQGLTVDYLANELRLPSDLVREIAALDEDRPSVFASEP